MKHWLNRNVVGLSLASLFSDWNHEMVPLLLPIIISQLMGVEAPYYLGLISGISGAASSGTGLLSGLLSDRLTYRKPLLILGYGLMGLLVGFIGNAQHWLTILVLLTAAWIGRGLIKAPRNALLSDSVAPAYYGRAFGFRQAFDTLGATIGPLTVFFFAALPVSTLFYTTFIPGLLALSIIIIMIQERPHKKISTSVKIKLPKSFYVFAGIYLIFALGNFSRTLLILRTQEMINPLTMITLLYVTRNITQTLASYFIGRISDTIGRRLPLSILGFALFGIVSIMLIYPVSFIAIFILSGISAGTYTTLRKVIVADLVPEEQRGTGYGVLFAIESVGQLLSSSIFGLLWQSYSLTAARSYAALLSFIAAFLSVFIKQSSVDK